MLHSRSNCGKMRRCLSAALHRTILIVPSDNPTPEPYFIAASNAVPLPSEFKAPMKLLSRKPQPKPGMSSQMGGLSLNDGDDSEEEERKKAEEAFKERQIRAQKEREEKQRLYNERRAELLGTPAEPQGRSSPQNKNRGKGKGRGGYRNGEASNSSADQSPARGANSRRGQLYEPSYSPKPNSTYIQRRAGDSIQASLDTTKEQQPIRAPRNPDSSGRGGFGFAPRGNLNGGIV